MFEGLGGDLQGVVRVNVEQDSWNIIKRPVLHARTILDSELPDVMMLRTVFLDEKNFGTAAVATTGRSPLEPASDLLQMLQYASEDDQAELDAAFAAAFPPLGVRLDESETVRLTLRVAEEFPEPIEDRVERARAWSKLPALDDAGRGVRNFATLALSVLMLKGRIIIADEPDGALLPFAARQLGRWLATAATEYNCQLIVSARSPSLVAGMLERSSEVSLLHTSGQHSESPLGAVSPATLKAVAKCHLVAIDDALEALERSGAIIIEDPLEAAAFAALNANRGGADRWRVICVHNMAAAAPLVRMLHEAGTPVAVMVRLIHLRERDAYRELLAAATRDHAPSAWLATRDQLARHVAAASAHESSKRTEAMEAMLENLNSGDQNGASEDSVSDEDRDPWGTVSREGVAAIPVDQRTWVEQLIEELKTAGIFVASHGTAKELQAAEMESLFKSICSGQAPDRMAMMLTEVFQYLRHPTTPQHS